jgi:hypothetical protein
MTTEISGNLFDEDDFAQYADYLNPTNITWEGREIDLSDLSSIEASTERRIISMLFTEDARNPDFQWPLAQLAWAGSDDEQRITFQREFAEIFATPEGLAYLTKQGTIQLASWADKIKKFWKKHKKEIIIGAIIVAAVAAVVVVATCISASAACATAVASAAALDSKDDSLTKEPSSHSSTEFPPLPSLPKSNSHFSTPITSPPLSGLPPSLPEAISLYSDRFLPRPSDLFPTLSNPSNAFPAVPDSAPAPTWNERLQEYQRDSLFTDKKEPSVEAPYPYPTIQAEIPNCPEPYPSLLSRVFSGNWERRTDLPPLPSRGAERSRFLNTGDVDYSQFRIAGINGINTTPGEAKSHADYLSSLGGDRKIEWLYNCSHSLPVDIVECAINQLRHLPPEKILVEEWTKFHEENKDNPEAKYLQFCHSGGTTHVKNGLDECPPEIRNRIIVVAIAPAAIIPDGACFESHKYASDHDGVFLAEFFTHLAALYPNKAIEDIKNLSGLIILEAHPDAPLFDHDFQSPTFKNIIKYHIKEYIEKHGEIK